MGLIAAVCGFGVIAMNRHDVVALLGSSLASSSVILTATWCTLSRRKKLLRVAVLLCCLTAAVITWHFTAWFDLYLMGELALLYGSSFEAMQALSTLIFGLILASCTTVMIKAFHQRLADPIWVRQAARGIAIAATVVAVVLGGFFYHRLAKRLPIPPANLPAPNGHDYFARAGNLLSSTTRIPEPPSDPPAVIARFVKGHGESFSLLRQGLEVECKKALEWKEGGAYFSDELDSVQLVRHIARAFRAESQMYAESQNYESAAQSCVDCVRFAHKASRGGLVVHYLVASAVESVGTHEMPQLLTQLDSSVCRAASAQLLQVDADREQVTDFIRRDELWSQVTLGWLSRTQFAMADLFQRPREHGLVLDALEKRNDTIRRLLIVELALRAFTLEHESPPRQLSDLVPEYLPRLIHDPYDNAPLRYGSDDRTAIVYSVGPDMDDDNAKGLTWNEFSSGDDGDVVLNVLIESVR
ncbi:MAG: hypothetical protein CMJ64_26425 [Planctomycetaceae bacterium]|nr:hypothetical protein [Planctomycetaceae bacterium]